MSNHFMIDLETMSTAADAAILSIGIQPFDPRGDGIDLAAGLLIHVDLQACMNAGLRVDADTILWWLQQSDEARAGLLVREPLMLSEALRVLITYGQDNGGWSWAKVWGNGAAFDIPILETAFRRCRMDIPWEYNNVLDVRTMKWLAPDVPKVAPDVAHNALSDAQAQAVYVQRCHAAIKGGPIEITGEDRGPLLVDLGAFEKPGVFFVLNGLVNGEEGMRAVPAGGGRDEPLVDGWYIDREPDGEGPFETREEALKNA